MNYFTDNKKIVIHTTEGETIEQEVETSSTPKKGKFDAIRKAEREGTATFKDVAKFTGHECEVIKAELYYDEEKVGERTFPLIKIGEQDILEVTYQLTLQRIDGVVRIKT